MFKSNEELIIMLSRNLCQEHMFKLIDEYETKKISSMTVVGYIRSKQHEIRQHVYQQILKSVIPEVDKFIDQQLNEADV